MKLGRTIVETGKLSGLKPYQTFYHSSSTEESSFGVLRSLMLVMIPMETLTRADDEIPHSVRNIISNYEQQTSGEPRIRLRKALNLSKSRGITSDETHLTIVIFSSDGTIISNNSGNSLLRVHSTSADLIPLKRGKVAKWHKKDTFLLAPPDFFSDLSPETAASLIRDLPTAEIPGALLRASGRKRPCSLLSLRILPPTPILKEPVVFVTVISLLLIVLFYLAVWPNLPK